MFPLMFKAITRFSKWRDGFIKFINFQTLHLAENSSSNISVQKEIYLYAKRHMYGCSAPNRRRNNTPNNSG